MAEIRKSKAMFCILLILSLLFFALFAAAQETGRVYLLSLNYKKLPSAESLSLINLQIADGSAADPSSQPANGYLLDISSPDGQILSSAKFIVPVGAVMLNGLTQEQVQGSVDDLNFTISVPYFSNAGLITIYDKSGANKILEIPIDTPGKSIWPYIAGLLLLVLAILLSVRFRKKANPLRNYVAANLKKGYTKEQIRNALLKNGYSNKEIEKAFR
ncbi:MAG: hypothetical protein AABX51_01290 [Nanoarchaeota archaeon]